MSAACASVICKTPVIIKGAQAVKNRYPGFWHDFETLGGKFKAEEIYEQHFWKILRLSVFGQSHSAGIGLFSGRISRRIFPLIWRPSTPLCPGGAGKKRVLDAPP